MTKATPAAIEMQRETERELPASGTGAKLIARINAATSTTERMPPRLSTGSVALVHVARNERDARTSATTASGSVTRNTEPHQ